MTTLSAEVPDILSDEHDKDPQIAYRYLREEAPVVFHPGSNSYLLSRHADILRLIRGKDVTSANYGDGLGSSSAGRSSRWTDVSTSSTACC